MRSISVITFEIGRSKLEAVRGILENVRKSAFKRGLKAKSIGVFRVWPIVLEIFYFKHDVSASNIIIFIGNSDAD